MRRWVLPGMAIGLALFGLAVSAPAGRFAPGPSMPAAGGAPVVRVQGEACTEACRRDHSACLIREKGSPACNTRLQRCLQACLARKREH